MGVVTGIVQEFQFGMNWSEYSRYVGDIFGAPLAIEALMAFFLESTFIGMWLFGWNRLPQKIHLLTIWLVAIAANISALWILTANSWMQQPVGYALRNGRAEMTDFVALLTNSHLWVQFPHVFFAGLSTGAFFMLGIVAFRLLRKDRDQVFFRTSFKMASVAAIIGASLVILVGHSQAQHMVQVQPMKMAAAEALWNTEESAGMSLFTIGDTRNLQDVFSIRIPSVLSILACNQPNCAVQGINELQAQYEQQFGPGNYVPNIFILYWSFRAMVGAGFLMLLIALWALVRALRDRVHKPSWILPLIPFAIALPYLANTTGWLLTEMGRYPWLVWGVLRLEQGVSPVPAGQVLATLLGFTLVYGALMVADVYLLVKYARADTELIANDGVPDMTPSGSDEAGLLLRPS
jgi:cytochrome d ubiquinol oxidase subunit I